MLKNLLTGKLNHTGRILFLVAAILLVVSLYFPWWTLALEAPQYPEGLRMSVYAYKLGGNIDILNNLNHYIGMREIKESNFPELTIIPKVVWVVVALSVLTALLGRSGLALFTAVLASVGGLVGLQRMFHWLQKFGTDLDPHAPIKIPPFVPPAIGENKMANFVTHSSFDWGGYLLGLAILLMFISLWRSRQCEKLSSSASTQSSC